MKTVKEIHNAFSTIPKRKFEKEPLSIVSDDKAEKLKMLGFESSPLVVKLNSLIEENDNIEKRNKEKEEIVKAVNYFNIHYPNNILLLEKEVEELCREFDLILGKISDFIGDVPDNTIEEMLSFKLNEVDRTFEKPIPRFPLRACTISMHSIHKVTKSENNDKFILESSQEIVFENVLEIIASPKLFLNNPLYKNIGEIATNDPIVVQRVMYNNIKGFLIISKWGNETSIDTLNYKNN